MLYVFEKAMDLRNQLILTIMIKHTGILLDTYDMLYSLYWNLVEAAPIQRSLTAVIQKSPTLFVHFLHLTIALYMRTFNAIKIILKHDSIYSSH